MKNFKNNLGWYFYKSRSGLRIKRKNPSKKSQRNRIIREILFWIIVAFVIYYGVILEEESPPEIAFSIIIVFMFIIVIFGLLSKFWLLQILYINRRSYSLIINSVHINKRDQRLPCYLFKAEIEHISDTGLYRVYLKPSKFIEIDGPTEDWNSLVWESTDGKEAFQIMKELRNCGVGETDFEKQHPIIRGNKKAGVFILACYLLCLFYYALLYCATYKI